MTQSVEWSFLIDPLTANNTTYCDSLTFGNFSFPKAEESFFWCYSLAHSFPMHPWNCFLEAFLTSSVLCRKSLPQHSFWFQKEAQLVADTFNPLSAKYTKWSNTHRQFVGKLPTNCLSVFDHFVGLLLKGLNN